jgi:hypothetical protein
VFGDGCALLISRIREIERNVEKNAENGQKQTKISAKRA